MIYSLFPQSSHESIILFYFFFCYANGIKENVTPALYQFTQKEICVDQKKKITKKLLSVENQFNIRGHSRS